MKTKKQGKGKAKKKARFKTGTITAPVSNEHTGYGILPDRDLKKNLGCG